jgi:hypothetical protein
VSGFVITRLADALRIGPVILDGGLATQLESHGHHLDSPKKIRKSDPRGFFQLSHEQSSDSSFMGMRTPRSAATCSARS